MLQAGLNIIYFCATCSVWKRSAIKDSLPSADEWAAHGAAKGVEKKKKKNRREQLERCQKNYTKCHETLFLKVSWKYENIKKSFSVTVFTVNIQSSQSRLHSIYKNITGNCWIIHIIAKENWGTWEGLFCCLSAGKLLLMTVQKVIIFHPKN